MINRIAMVLKEKNAVNNDLVKYLKVEKETVSRWVNNKQQPTVTTLNKIAEFLRVDIRDLLNPSDWTNSKVIQFEKKK